MDNNTIADNFTLLSKLMDIHGENSFKTKSYSIAAFTIEKLQTELKDMEAQQIFSIKGIGDAIGKKIIEQLETGQFALLNKYLESTPPGILEMLSIKGIGPKKIAVIWKELEIETLGELLYACNENRLTLFKGFGEKTQKNIRDAIEFYMNAQGSYLFQQVEQFSQNLDDLLKTTFPDSIFILTGEIRRQFEIIEKIEWVTTTVKVDLTTFFKSNNYDILEDTKTYISFKGNANITLGFHLTSLDNIYNTLFLTCGSDSFLSSFNAQTSWEANGPYPSEEAIFSVNGLSYIPPYLRETANSIVLAKNDSLPEVIKTKDIKGIIHSHSTWSDGNNTLEEMAEAAISKGFEYLVISDHSKSAFYANGLSEERILAQHQQIHELNLKYAPFRIFKSIESDILNDGSLDYPESLLSAFDLVIASVHSNLKMTEEKAMTRILKAIENPYTSILGHMTGRLLLSRAGYPVDHKKIIDACAIHDVVIELNAHPRRLDIDWRWIEYAISKNVLISINPDAHKIDSYDDCRYGILVAQKAGLTKEMNLSSFSLKSFEAFIMRQQRKRP